MSITTKDLSVFPVREDNGWSVNVSMDSPPMFNEIHVSINGLSDMFFGLKTDFFMDPGDVREWSPDSPHVYPVTIEINGEKRTEDIAFCEYGIEDDGTVYVNDKKFPMRGAILRTGKRVKTESLIKSASEMALNVIVIPKRNRTIESLCLKSGILPFYEDEIPESITEIHSLPSSLGNYSSETRSATELIDAIVESRIKGTGFVINSLNDVSEDLGNGALTPDGRWKLPAYGIRRFCVRFCPLISVKDRVVSVYVANDSDEDRNTEVSFKIRDYSGRKLETKEYNSMIHKNSTVLIDRIRLSQAPEKAFCYVKISTKEKLRERSFMLMHFTALSLEDPKITVKTEKTDGNSILIKMEAEKPAFLVSLYTDIKGCFSDNMVSIRPSSPRTIVFRAANKTDPDEFGKSLKVLNVFSR